MKRVVWLLIGGIIMAVMVVVFSHFTPSPTSVPSPVVAELTETAGSSLPPQWIAEHETTFVTLLWLSIVVLSITLAFIAIRALMRKTYRTFSVILVLVAALWAARFLALRYVCSNGVCPPTDLSLVWSLLAQWVSPGVRTWFYTFYPYLLVGMAALAIFLMYRWSKTLAILVVIVLLAGGVLYLFQPASVCDEEDHACIAQRVAAEQKKADEAAAEFKKKIDEGVAARRQALARAEQQRSFTNWLEGTDKRSTKCKKVKEPFTYTSAFKRVPGDGDCTATFDPGGHTIEVLLRSGAKRIIRDDPTLDITIDPAVTAVRVVDVPEYVGTIVLYPVQTN